MCWRLGAASIFLVIYITNDFSRLLKIAFLGRAKSTWTCLSCVWWSCNQPCKRCVCISLTWSDQNASQRPPGRSRQTQQMVGKFSLAPSCSPSSPVGRTLAPWRRVARALSPGRRKVDLLTHEPIFHSRRHHGQTGRLQRCWVSSIEDGEWDSAPHELPQLVVAVFLGRGNRGERPTKTDCELSYHNVPQSKPHQES